MFFGDINDTRKRSPNDGMAVMLHSKRNAERRVGSTPTWGTWIKLKKKFLKYKKLSTTMGKDMCSHHTFFLNIGK